MICAPVENTDVTSRPTKDAAIVGNDGSLVDIRTTGIGVGAVEGQTRGSCLHQADRAGAIVGDRGVDGDARGTRVENNLARRVSRTSRSERAAAATLAPMVKVPAVAPPAVQTPP